MTSWDEEYRRKLDERFHTVNYEHDRLLLDLNVDQQHQHRFLFDFIDKWEHDSIKKIQKVAKHARIDLQRELAAAKHDLKYSLNSRVTEALHDAKQQHAGNVSEFDIDLWMAQLSELRRQLETLSSTIKVSHHKVINLIKIKRISLAAKTYNRQKFGFTKVRGDPVFWNTGRLITWSRPTTILSQNKYAVGTHYFRFGIEQTIGNLFLGIISDKDTEKLEQHDEPIESIHGWWNIDRRVVAGRKAPYVSARNMRDGDQVILILNCDAREIFLQYPSMTKLNALEFINDIRECAPPWRLLIEMEQFNGGMLRLLDWGVTAHGTESLERHLHCFCSNA